MGCCRYLDECHVASLQDPFAHHCGVSPGLLPAIRISLGSAIAATVGIHCTRTLQQARLAVAVPVAVPDDARLHKGAAADDTDGVGVVVAQVKVLRSSRVGGCQSEMVRSTVQSTYPEWWQVHRSTG